MKIYRIYEVIFTIEGKDYEISLWVKEGKNGKFFSGTIKEPYKKTEAKNDDIPF